MQTASALILSMAMLAPAARTQPAKASFEVASIKVHEFPPGIIGLQIGGPSVLRISGDRVTTNGSLETFVMAAYNLRLHQVSGGPKWTDREGNPLVFDVQAKAGTDGVLSMERAREMMQSLLAERFHLAIHRDTREMPLYELTVDKRGFQAKPSAPETETTTRTAQARGIWRFTYTNVSMADLATRIASNFDQPVIDRTGLAGGYDLVLEYRRMNVAMTPEQAQRADADNGPTIFTALQKLGLKVVHTKGPFEMTVIDHAEKPSEN